VRRLQLLFVCLCPSVSSPLSSIRLVVAQTMSVYKQIGHHIDNINQLPDDCLLKIFSKLPARDTLAADQVCHRWAAVQQLYLRPFSGLCLYTTKFNLYVETDYVRAFEDQLVEAKLFPRVTTSRIQFEDSHQMDGSVESVVKDDKFARLLLRLPQLFSQNIRRLTL